jgi:O-antigen/teichoic acid export membrane protein
MSTTTLRARVAGLRADTMLSNSALLFSTTVMMAGGGALFWVVAARLQSPENVGLAGSLVSTSDSIALFAQLGLNITLIKTMPSSERKASDAAVAVAIVAGAGGLFALVFSLLLPMTSPQLHAVLGSPWATVLFVVLVAGTAVNVLSDSIFLSINRVWSYLWLNGVLLGLVKCTLPFLLVGAGVMGLYGSVGGAALFCGATSLWVIFRHLPGPRTLSPSPQLRSARGFAGAGYATYVLNVIPQMVLPLIVINARGPADGAVFFLSVQIITLQNAVILAVGNSMYAESQRTPERTREVVGRGGATLLVVGVIGAVGVVLLAPYFLMIFGSHYADEGTTTLRVFSVCVLALGFNYWSAMRLRIAHRTRAMVGVQLTCTVAVLGLATVAAPHGTVWVALAWGAGQLVGGIVGYAASRSIDHHVPVDTVTAERVEERA